MANAPSRFTHNNDSFTCENCGRTVPPRTTGCRNHCPFCLVSKHVDVNPGDRAHPCGGLMDAVSYEPSGKKGLILHFRCRRCGAELRNVSARDGESVPDDYDLILKISTLPP